MKTGVCYHYTRLSNALLYALGYKVLHVSGYCSDVDNEFGIGNLHAFSLIKLKDNKWYPFDSTWGVFTGKLHVGHVFRMIGNKNFNWRSLNYMKIVTWVKNNIKYDYNLVLKKHSALQIYNMKTGVCYHYFLKV